MQGRSPITRYSQKFKEQVLSDIEEKGLTQSEAKRKYGIRGESTIGNWMKKYGKARLLNRIVRIEMPNETPPGETIKQLKNEKQQLESALAQAQLKILAYETMMDLAEKKYNVSFKKNSGGKQSGPSSRVQGSR